MNEQALHGLIAKWRNLSLMIDGIDYKKCADELEAALASQGSQAVEFSALDDELRQCLQIIIANAGNIKDDRNGPILEECIAIEDAAERAARALRAYAAARKDGEDDGIGGPYVCPVCSGRGNVPQGFYYPYDVAGYTTAPLPERCRTCGGSGMLWRPDMANGNANGGRHREKH